MLNNTISLKELKELIKQLVTEALESVDEKYSKKAAKAFVKHHKTFDDKVAALKGKESVESPEGLAAWIEKQATGKWPTEK